jgi:hypothetical protein
MGRGLQPGVAMRPRRARLLLATSLAVVDAALSLGHLAWVGFGSTALDAWLRTIATTAPVVGAALLAWATTRTTAGRSVRQARTAGGTCNLPPDT